MLVSKAEVSSRVSTETRAVIDGYQRMVTSLVTGKNGLSGHALYAVAVPAVMGIPPPRVDSPAICWPFG